MHQTGHTQRLATVLLLVAITGCGQTETPKEASENDAPPAQVPPARVVDSRPNAATEYARIHDVVGKDFLKPLGDIDTQTPPDQSQSAFLASKQDIVRDIIAASKLDRCEFGTDFTQGFDTLMPYLGWLREFARLLAYDANRHLMQPSGQAGAAERLMAIIRLGKHAGTEPTVIGRLVALSCVSLSSQLINGSKSRLTDPQIKKQILAELESVRNGEVFDYLSVFRSEFRMIKTAIENSGGSVSIVGNDIPVSESEKAALIAEIDRMFKEIEAAWGAPDAETTIKSIVENSRNPKARAFMGGYSTLPKTLRRGLGELDSAIAAMR